MPTIIRVPGKGHREIIDTTYEVRDGDAVLATYSSARDADTFVKGYEAACRGDRLTISFSGEASEGFADWIGNHKGWYVRITAQDGQTFDAVIVDNALNVEIDGDEGWYDGVVFKRADPRTGLVAEGAKTEALRVEEVHVY